MQTLNYPKELDSEKKKLEFLETQLMKLRDDRVEYYYTKEEMNKTIDAIRLKYGISECDSLPYRPVVTKIRLFGKTDIT